MSEFLKPASGALKTFSALSMAKCYFITFCCIAKFVRYTHIHISTLFYIPFPYRPYRVFSRVSSAIFSVQFSRSVMSDSLQPYGLQHKLPVHHQHLELAQTHVHHVSDASQPSHPLSSPSPPAFNLSRHQVLFK